VVDTEGKGVPGATVWAIGRSWDTPGVSARATAAASGRFILPGAWKLDELNLIYMSVFARATDGRCGWIATVWKNQPGGGDLSIELGDVGEASGRLVDESGKPVAGCRLSVDSLDRSPGKPELNDTVRLPAAVATAYAASTDSEGRFAIRGIPHGAKIQALVHARELGDPEILWGSTRATTITVDRRLGSISGRLRVADERPLAGTIKLSLRRKASNVLTDQAPFQVHLFRTITVNRDGTFQIGNLPPGPYDLTPEFSADAPFTAKPIATIEVKPGAVVANREIPLVRIPLVTGRVVDGATGQGIAGVGVRSYRVRSDNNLEYGNQATTDHSGRYTVAVEPGIVKIQPDSPPKTHMAMDREHCPKQKVQADQTWPDLKLARAIEIDGFVVDSTGKPVPGAEVYLVVPYVGGFGFGADSGPTISGEDGSFRLEQLDPDDLIPVRARTHDAATDGAIVIRTKEQKAKGKLTVTIDPKFAFRVKGRVVDQRGRPVPGVPVTLSWSRMLVSEKQMQHMGLGSGLDFIRTDQDGRFDSRALWPGDRYKASVESKVFARAETPEVQGSAGQVHDFGTIALVEATEHLAGQVLDSHGKPVAGARVFNRGDSPRPSSTTTSGDGRFRLEGLFSTARFAFARRDGFRFARLADAMKTARRKFVFVRKDGYRFKGVAVEGESDDLTIRLLSYDEPPPEWKPSESPSYEEQKAFAKETLVKLWQKYGENAGQNGGWVLVNQMAEVDHELALTWSAENANRFDQDIRLIAARKLAETDVPAALKRLNEEKGARIQNTLQELANGFLEHNKSTARLFAEAAAERSRALNQPERAMGQAQAGEVLVRAGESEAGSKLIEAATEAALKMDISGQGAYARGTVARALALVALDRATALIDPMKTRSDKDRYTAFIIEAISQTNPEKALALVDTLETNSSMPQTLRTGIAYAIAPTKPDAALRIAEALKHGYSGDKYQAEALGWLAVAIASQDKAKAYALIDRALAIPIDSPQDFGSYTYFGGALASSAGIALNARKIGYPDMESVMMWVMAARPDGQSGFSDPAMQTLSATIATPLVALLDPAAARTVLGQIEARSGLSPPELAKIAGEWWLAAWSLADLKHVQPLVEAELDALGGEKTNVANSGLVKMTEVLLTPPHRREQLLREKIGAVWRPGFAH
jgi:protocatechuate 3,4-dioxygenase beta subunit